MGEENKVKDEMGERQVREKRGKRRKRRTG